MGNYNAQRRMETYKYKIKMNEIGYYNHNNKTFKISLDLKKTQYRYQRREFLFTLKIQCYVKEMFEHFVNAWNLDKTKFENLDWNAKNYNHCLIFKGDWHEARQFLIIVDKYLNDREIELIINYEMIGAVLMMRELGR